MEDTETRRKKTLSKKREDKEWERERNEIEKGRKSQGK